MGMINGHETDRQTDRHNKTDRHGLTKYLVI